ncbi:unnamed protein product [Rhizophagus irregularis]|uniref:CxC2-like cysteine cluster KDZ transposase-associated domain-containing protein n=1 Tax=Rhizophagus irregularis TaxID=588596 RepID=A0A916EJQ6_9GLOM|nr:unnamed protein product [Rhizophagus irregularis]
MNKGNLNKKGKISYRPYLVSSNKKNAKKVVINRYAKGSNKYRAKNLSENIYKSTEIVDEDRNNDEWIDIDIIKEDENYKNNAINKDSKCFKCNSPAICYCLDCGLNTYLCLECNTLYHKDINLFHRKVFISNIFDKEEIKLPQLCTGFCEHEIKEISIINLKGIFKAKFPTCEGLVETLIRHKLFPSTPINPQVAFSFELFDIYQELLLEAHVSYLSFCRVLESLFSDQDITRVKTYIIFFKSAFHQYLGLKTMIENTINKLFSSKSQFNCPACPQPEEKNSKIIIALDANFQLKRMKSAGSNIGERIIEESFILNQNKYDEWVQNSINLSSLNTLNINNNNAQINVCDSHFKAANQTKANLKSNYLDDTGIFGSTCRHGIPLKFINLKGIGERFSLAEYILSDLHNMFYEDSSTFIVLYDIACNLHSHVEKSESRLFPFKSRFNWCVSIFHAYAHSMKCQLNYHPRACNSIGLTDGESLERLWSYLGRFSSTTRYMRPHHRLDILEKGIQHISRKMISNLACNLVKRFKNAYKIMNVSVKILKEMEQMHGIDESKILYYIQCQYESNFANSERQLESLKRSRSLYIKKVEKCESDLDIPESKRWNPFNPIYSKYFHDYCERNLDLISDKLRKFRNEYIFKNSQLYNQDHIGHKLTLKIKSSIKDISKQIEINISYYEYFRLLAQENSFCKDYPKAIFNEIVNHTSDFWQILDISINDKMDNIPRIVIFNSIKNFNNLQWSKEEISLIVQELKRLYDFWMNYKIKIENKLQQLQQFNEKTTKNIEEDNLLKGDLAENLTELEICDNEECIEYEGEIVDKSKDCEEEIITEGESMDYKIV